MKPWMIDIVGLLGLASLFYGCWLVTPPLAFIVTGTLLVLYSVKASAVSIPKKAPSH